MAEPHGRSITLLPSAARGTGTVAGESTHAGGIKRMVVLLDTTAVSGTIPTSDVKIQTSVNGANWDDVAAFAQVTTASRRYLYFSCDIASTSPEHVEADGTLAAATVRQGPLGEMIRAKAITAGTTPSVTSSCIAYVNYG